MSVYSIYFSPTQGTKKITNTLAKEISEYKEIDLCVYKEEIKEFTFSENDICFIGVPSYGGRVPNVAIERIKCLNGNNAKAVLVVSYGNRDYDDTLIELYDVVKEQGFICISGVTAIAEHSIMRQFASGRPDIDDIKQLKEFAKEIQRKIANPVSTELELKGNRPYKKYNGVPLKPKAGKNCTNCGLCAKMCPVGAIPQTSPNKTDTNKCISCMRCLDVCPQQTRTISRLKVKLASKKMEKVCLKCKENEIFL